MMKDYNYQDSFLAKVRQSHTPVTMFLVNGFQMRGTVEGFDVFTVLLLSEGRQSLIFKHAISTIIPLQSIPLPDSEN